MDTLITPQVENRAWSPGRAAAELELRGWRLVVPFLHVFAALIGLAGLIGGGPVFLGSLIGYNVTSEPLELAFYALAGGAILYVIGEVWQGMRRYGHRELGLFVLGAGFTLAVITDMVIVYGGG